MAIKNKSSVKEEVYTEVFVPRASRGDNARFVAVNGERILIRTGEPVSVPERFAEVIKNSERCAEESARYIDDNASL